MADNKIVNGVTVATDEVAGVDFQKMKLIDGTPDGVTPAIVSGSGGLRVDLATALDRNVDSVGIGLWNGAAEELAQGNNDRALLASASRTATIRADDLVNINARGVVVRTSITANPGTLGSITVTIWGKDAVTGDFWLLAQSPTLTAVGHSVLKVYPGIAVAANVALNDVLPRLWMVQVGHNNANPITYSVGASLIV